YAAGLAGKYKKVAFIATCQGLDKEMKERILKHRGCRPKDWITFEEPKGLKALLSGMGNAFDCIIIDCLTLLVSNLILSKHKEKKILNIAAGILEELKKKKAKAIIVSNEVGLGIVPVSKLGRDFRDIAGKVNQIIAQEADKVIFMVAGVPLKVK
ncbi:MAG: bifunctional adenosylcobinamide kinase/adenosylcobinamide-phosphate guanylyltransferase, partial [Candidatus Omnitrophica bacterium]|nr:bifunctional adenosylcobinamide kinase/adenosylcobinamide-phosphate guanylyltransferase [Candidatus Omnitrophota bacterium]